MRKRAPRSVLGLLRHGPRGTIKFRVSIAAVLYNQVMGLSRRWVVSVTVMWLGVHALAASPARVFVEPLGTKSGAAQLRNELVHLLEKEHGIALVSDAAAADFIISGEGDTYIKGYVGSNPRVRYLNGDARPVYGGFLSVEVKNREHDTIWSYLVTPRRLGSEDINRNLTGQLARKLVGAIEAPQGVPKP